MAKVKSSPARIKKAGSQLFIYIFCIATLCFVLLQGYLFWEETQLSQMNQVKEQYTEKLNHLQKENDQLKGQLQEAEEKLELVIRETESKEALAEATRQAEAARLEASSRTAYGGSPTYAVSHPSTQSAQSLTSIAAQKAEAARDRLAAIKASIRRTDGGSALGAGVQSFTKPADNTAFKTSQQMQEQREAATLALRKRREEEVERQRQLSLDRQEEDQHGRQLVEGSNFPEPQLQDAQQQLQLQQLAQSRQEDERQRQEEAQLVKQRQEQELQLLQQRQQQAWGNTKPVTQQPSQSQRSTAAPRPTYPQQPEKVVAAVVIMACNRHDYLNRTLASVFKVNPSLQRFPLFVSQDGTNQEVKALAESFEPRLTYLQHIEAAPPKMKTPKESIVYYRIAYHYEWALKQLFDGRGFERVIILEDDMELSPDFFSFFEATAPILDADPTLWCVSSWNDNGLEPFVSDPKQVYRSDFFPGLGWMLTKREWAELGTMWTTGPPSIPGIFGGYWDDWMRSNEVRRGRQCLRPEVCRTFNFGEVGSSKGQFFQQYLSKIKLNDVNVDFAALDLSYLSPEVYPVEFQRQLADATEANQVSELESLAEKEVKDVKLIYRSQKHFEQLARQLRIMGEWKAGVPRGSYQGVVTFKLNEGRMRVFLAPSPKTINLHQEGWIIPPDGSRP